MGFNKVYSSLQELFPQIDARVLRAVAIEHSKNVDSAVDAVLGEIIPFFTERSKPSSPFTGSSSVEKSFSAVQNDYNLIEGNKQSVHHADADNVHNEPSSDNVGHQDGEGNVSSFTMAEKNQETSNKMSSYMHSHADPVMLVNTNDNIQTEVSGDPMTEEIVSADKSPDNIIKTPPYFVFGAVENVDMNPSTVTKYSETPLQNDFGMDNVLENDQSVSCGDANTPSNWPASFAAYECTLESSIQSQDIMHESNLDNLEVSLSSDTVSKMDATTSVAGSEADSALNASLTQSSQIHIMEVLEDIITDGRSNKKILFSATESVMSLMREVELQEHAAEQAKEEAAVGGTDILEKVEELMKMLQHAKEANDMHAGEVYGEKAILATEVRELQSRLLSLADERDKSLAILDEMRQALQLRLAAAEIEIKYAEQEKLEKENSARKALADQELIMDKVVQESNTLKQQAEDNAKLQEFLLDRGHVVDMLQGEIAVICKDVGLLKQKFDEKVPFSKSVSSSQTSCILASSTSSFKSLIPDQVEPVLDLAAADSLEAQKKTSSSSSSSSSFEHVSDDEAARDDHKSLLDDGWNFLETDDIDG